MSRDRKTGCAANLDIFHNRGHEAQLCYLYKYTAVVADSASTFIYVITGDKEVHLDLVVQTDASGVFTMDTATLAGVAGSGTKKDVFLNYEHYQVKDDIVTGVYDAITGSPSLSEVMLLPIFGTIGPPFVNSFGGSGSVIIEQVLKPNSLYVLEVNNNSGGNEQQYFYLQWYTIPREEGLNQYFELEEGADF